MKIIKVSPWRATLLLVLSFLLPHQVLAEADWFEKGLLLTRARQYDEAIEAFSTAIELIPWIPWQQLMRLTVNSTKQYLPRNGFSICWSSRK